MRTLELLVGWIFPIIGCAFLVSGSTAEDPFWNDLKVTFGFDIWNKFNSVPRTVADALKDGWTNISPKNGTDCTNEGQFNGFRYIEDPMNPGLSLLYDVRGTIGGIQMNLLKKEILSPNNLFNYKAVTMYQSNTINGQEVYTLTAYLVPPEDICKTGRCSDVLQTEGTGSVLIFQNGSTPADVIKVPLHREYAAKEGWTNNNCFIGMGYHNFYKPDEFANSNCREIRPVFLLFNKAGQLHGIGLTSQGFASSTRFEHPSAFLLKKIIGDNVAQCILDVAESPKFTSIHIYFTKHPYLTTCF